MSLGSMLHSLTTRGIKVFACTVKCLIHTESGWHNEGMGVSPVRYSLRCDTKILVMKMKALVQKTNLITLLTIERVPG